MTTETKATSASWLVEDMLAEKQRIKQAADQAKASAQAEAERIKAKLPLPPASSEGMFEVRFVQALVEIMTGRATVAKPDMVKMPETLYEPIALVLSSTGQFYYRVTPNGCTCKGFLYRKKCRHFKAAFPELAKEMEAAKAPAPPKAAKPKPEAVKQLSPEQAKEAITKALKGKFTLFRSVSCSGIDSLTLKIAFKDDYSAAENAQVEEIKAAAQAAAPGLQIYVSKM
jgi:hypothetical protein